MSVTNCNKEGDDDERLMDAPRGRVVALMAAAVVPKVATPAETVTCDTESSALAARDTCGPPGAATTAAAESATATTVAGRGAHEWPCNSVLKGEACWDMDWLGRGRPWLRAGVGDAART